MTILALIACAFAGDPVEVTDPVDDMARVLQAIVDKRGIDIVEPDDETEVKAVKIPPVADAANACACGSAATCKPTLDTAEK